MSSISTSGVAVAQPQQVVDGGDQVVRPQRHFVFGDVQAQLAVDAEAAHAAQPVAVGVVELLVEQGLGLFQLRRIAGPQPLVDPQQGLFVAGRGVVGQGVQAAAGFFGSAITSTCFRPEVQIVLGGVLGDLLAALDDDFAGPGAVGRIDDVADGQLALDLRRRCGRRRSFPSRSRRTPAAGRRCRCTSASIARSSVMIENLPLWSMRTDEAFLAGDVHLDPASAFGNDAAAMQAALAGAFHFGDEIDARAAVQLADDHALGAVDDELAAAEHDGHVAEIDFLLDRAAPWSAAARL